MSTTPPLQSHLMTLTNIRLILRASATAYVHAATIVTESHTYWTKWTNQRCGVGDDKYKIWGLELRYILGYIHRRVVSQYYIAHFFFKHSRSLIISPNFIVISTVAADWVKVILVGQHFGYHCCLTEFEFCTWAFWSLDVFHMSAWVNWCSVSMS